MVPALRVGDRVRCVRSACRGYGLDSRMILVTAGHSYVVSAVEDVGHGVQLVAVDGRGSAVWSAKVFELIQTVDTH